MGTKHWRGEHRKKGRHVPKERMTRACSPELEVAGNWNPLCQQERLFLNFPSWGHPCQSGFTKGFYTWKKVRRSQSDVFFCRQFMGTKVVAIFNCGALMERRVKPLGHLETACKHKADKWHHKVLERQNFFSYKLVLSDIISLPIAKQREQVVVEPPCSACTVPQTQCASLRAKEAQTARAGQKREKVQCRKRGIAPACASKLISNSLERK